MPNLFTTLGFSFRDEVDFLRLLQQATEEGETLNARRGYYVRWSPGVGAELWVQVNTEREVAGCQPHFAGAGSMIVGIRDLVTLPEQPLSGRIDGWAGPDSDDGMSGLFPVLVDLPDFDLVRRTTRPPVAVDLQIAAFAVELSCFVDDDEFYERKDKERRLAVEAFLPTGMFTASTPEEGDAEAVVSGHILSVELRINPQGKQGFWALGVRTFGGTVDVVADPLVVSGEPLVGGVASGTFWLSGRIRARVPWPQPEPDSERDATNL